MCDKNTKIHQPHYFLLYSLVFIDKINTFDELHKEFLISDFQTVEQCELK